MTSKSPLPGSPHSVVNVCASSPVPKTHAKTRTGGGADTRVKTRSPHTGNAVVNVDAEVVLCSDRRVIDTMVSVRYSKR